MEANQEQPNLSELTDAWKKAQPLNAEIESRLWRKLRLDWNFNSNHIEGNTLTYGETELLIIHGQTKGDHQLREYEEMKAHDLAIARLRELSKEGRPLNESEIRTWNEIILKEPFWKKAITPEGIETQKEIIPGRYKQTPNSVRTATGEIFEFAAPIEVPARMRDLVLQLNECVLVRLDDLPELLARTHHNFLMIHPFDDGNGRVGRLIINYILMLRGCVPLVIPSTEKKGYLNALRLADVGDLSSLTRFIRERLIAALKMGIRASRGESIDEPSDLEKQITLFVEEQAQSRRELLTKSEQVIRDLAETSLIPLTLLFDEKTKIFEKIFKKREIIINGAHTPDDLVERARTILNQGAHFGYQSAYNVQVRLRGYSSNAKEAFNVDASFSCSFLEYEYTIQFGSRLRKKWYADPLLSDERELIVKDLLDDLYTTIKKRLNISN